jgi:hypothetical protein
MDEMDAKTGRYNSLFYPNHRDKRCVLELSLARHDIFYPSKDSRSLLTAQREIWIQIALECR